MEALKVIKNNSTVINVDLRHALIMIAKALDYVGIDDVHHGHRVAYMALECAKRLGWSEEKCQFVYFAGMIHDCGVSSSNEHINLLSELQPEGIESHCLRGKKILASCKPLSCYATAVFYHHTAWKKLANINISDFDKEVSALIFLADRVDFLRARYLNNNHPNLITLFEQVISESILAHAGDIFHPEMAKTMAALVKIDGFWYSMVAEDIENIALQFSLADQYDRQLSIDEIIQLATFLANIVDAKSSFTFQHSSKVALICQQIAKDMELPEIVQKQLYIAGLLHDIGKLKVTDEILHKTGSLTQEEYSHMKRHSIDTRDTLLNIFPNSNIGIWASNHHERLDGSGYPYKLIARQLDLGSRIIAIVDIFQALSQKRPYRDIMKLNEIFSLMDPLIEAQKLDASVYQQLKDNGTYYYQLSTE
jgi:HD-GYP domain-containing protein (c-di-GMP phosphodiesterase class II)